MSLHVELSLADSTRPVERSDGYLSQTLPSAGVASSLKYGTQSAGDPGNLWIMTLTAEVDMFIDIATTPDATTNPRRRMKAGSQRSFAVPPGSKVNWSAT